MHEFVIIRLGKDSVPDIEKLDSFHAAPEKPIRLTVTCRQVPLDVGPGYYALLYLGSDNSKGMPTKWKQGIRALGKIVSKSGGSKYADEWQVDVEVKVVFPESISKQTFVKKASDVYYGFSGMPVIGISSYSNQTVQEIKTAEDTQNISSFFQALEVVENSISTQVGNYYPELGNLFSETKEEEEDEEEEPDGTLEVIEWTPGWDEYPLDSVFVRTEQRTVNEVVKRIDADRFILDPDFQRVFVWPLKKQSKLIESCLMRIPLPVFYVAEAKDGRIVVVDGLQRLFTFKRYINNEFALSGLGAGKEGSTVESPFDGKLFSELPLTLQERIEDTQITLYILDVKAPERAKLDIFDRVNSGEPLSRQQMRNCLFNGPATRWLGAAAQTAAFRDATGGTLDEKSMRDREAINRFCAFKRLGVEQYKGDMDVFLAATLEEMNTLSKIELDSLANEFERSMQLNYMLFGRHAFRKSLAEKTINAPRTVINISLFDVCSVLLAPFDDPVIENNADQLRSSIGALINNEDFIYAITYGTNGLPQVKTRFKMMKEAIGEVS